MADSSQTILRFACPFQKYDPQASRHCSQPSRRNAWGGFEDVHRVKQHVLNVHDKALFCHRCCRRWETPQHAREHEETANCEAIPTDRTDWMKPGQEKDVRKRIASKDPEDRWYTLFQRLFPHLPSEGPDSAREKYTPYYYAGAGSSVNCNMSSDESILSSSVGLFLDEPFAIYNTPPPQSMVSEHVATQEPSSLINTYSDYYTTDWLGDGLGNVNLQPASPRGANAFNGHNTTNPPLHKCFVFENSTSGNEIHDSKMANLSLMNPSLPLNDGQLTATNHADLRLHLSNSCDELRRRGSKIDRCLTAYSKLSACLDDMSNFAIELASNPADASRMRTLNAHIQLMRQVLANVF
ncbi:hypothetical protein B0J13DRAFT_616007 [Dactylonectria estremocensis]|uniref:C2H2-type domain-containing protein n=1 Tax=Dactylonectria estremocensis TaxID=1079267 RepID=A0A9P9FM49_9HYPO|nr:hypothetical protein B0J13DRAFT_616007 [Dactylonectria estremocensis]